jgi:hypothetical protein
VIIKLPKHRANLFLVERWSYENDATVIVGGFSEPQAAEEYKDACAQDLRDRGYGEQLDKGELIFNVVMTTYYET